MEYDDFVEVKALDENPRVEQPEIKVKGPNNLPLAQRTKTDLGGILDKNFLDGLVKPM